MGMEWSGTEDQDGKREERKAQSGAKEEIRSERRETRNVEWARAPGRGGEGEGGGSGWQKDSERGSFRMERELERANAAPAFCHSSPLAPEYHNLSKPLTLTRPSSSPTPTSAATAFFSLYDYYPPPSPPPPPDPSSSSYSYVLLSIVGLILAPFPTPPFAFALGLSTYTQLSFRSPKSGASSGPAGSPLFFSALLFSAALFCSALLCSSLLLNPVAPSVHPSIHLPGPCPLAV
ncbi:hypothetical protein MPTK1_3g02350 [Marchantia polymorpha subsp. ruderalis]|uniref:Uncharacterized protein n=2 Tax=Marchantia polymorpha TaxID=3197 RepID=A0AAF6AWN9_MARPO|nr:hypothetical protein MARPO_0007s0224 [Marchantia polymorpha]BBN04173.1 hypothetical protein Mp_3g02350 [Marchantia polymorpha subsp. ruderalis]|eukprot:PTQ47860.1 hypothetical protein MARPO_0007s0224 [Marchantia polymorpha]